MSALEKNQIYTCTAEGWSSEGAGVCRIEGRAVFVPGAIPGETWEVRIVKVTASAVYGRGERCLAPSPDRLEPDCPVFPRCGGCALRHVRYARELEFKLERVNEAYRRIGALALRAEEILGAAETEGYRNKAVYAVSPALQPGFFRPRSHEVIPVERCRLQAPASDRAAWAVCDFCRENGFAAYDEQSGRGLLRHVFVRSARDGRLQVAVVANGGFGAKTAALADAVRAACPELAGLFLNVNKSRGNTVLAGEFHLLWGEGTLEDTLCGRRFALSPNSFYQVNPAQAERLYQLALEMAAPEGTGTVLDLYCGAGTISLCLARGAAQVIGAEIVPAAVENARENAAQNGLHNVEFLCADAGEAAQTLLLRGIRPDAVVLDPPRKGLSAEVIDAVCGMAPARVVYVSCNVATQARDLAVFAQRGYAARRAVAVDLFPRTEHVETVVVLTRGVILFPELATLKEEIEKLHTELSMLVLARDELKYVECKNIEMQYMLALGSLEYKAFELHCAMLRLKRKIELIQAKKNRQEKVSVSAIDKLLDEEFAAYQGKLNEQINKMNAAFERSKGEFLTDEESKELKTLYRTVVKALHPDIHPGVSEAQVMLFQNAVDAYENGDLTALRIIKEMVAEPALPEPGEKGLTVFVKEKERLLKMLTAIKEQIAEIKEAYPYNLKPIVQNEPLIAEKKADLEDTVSKLQEMIEVYKKRIAEMLR